MSTKLVIDVMLWTSVGCGFLFAFVGWLLPAFFLLLANIARMIGWITENQVWDFEMWIDDLMERLRLDKILPILLVASIVLFVGLIVVVLAVEIFS